MTKQKQHVSSDYFGLISVDLFFNILSKLPLKSLAQCRCVSKQWSSVIRRPNYNQLFPIKSPVTPRILFFVSPGIFSSSPEPQNLDNWLFLVATRHTNSPTYFSQICSPIHGFVCRQCTGNNYLVAVISNPITGEYVTTPKVTIEGFDSKGKFYFGYDPIEKQFKVLSITWLLSGLQNSSIEYQVLTLGTGNLSWREINCCTLHYPCEDNGICINGVLYYQAIIDQKRLIACFDVRSERFSFVNIDQDLAKKIWEHLILIDYKGKLGVIHCIVDLNFFNLWVLEDAEEHKWSQHYYKMPQMEHPSLKSSPLFSAGMIGSGKIVLYQNGVRNPFCMFYYNLEKNIITRATLEVPGFDWVRYGIVQTFSNFVEDLKLM